MVELRPRQDLGHDSTIYVLSTLPTATAVAVFDSLTNASVSTRTASSVIPWRIQNRYYATEVQFTIFNSPAQIHEELKRVKKDIIPALMVLVDSSKPIDSELLAAFDAEAIDVPLVVGKSTGGVDAALPWEDMMQQCISKGWEYVDLSDDGEDELGGQSGVSRVSEALQAHIWPMNTRSSTRRNPSPSDSDDEETASPEASTSQHRSRRESSASSSDGFDDDFAPFVSAAAKDTVLSAGLTSPSLDDTSAPTFPSSDYPPFDDAGEDDPSAHLADMFASFAGLKERAMNMQDRNQKMEFAEEIALKFAKQLDLLMGDEMNDLETTQPPEVRQQESSLAESKNSADTCNTTAEPTVGSEEEAAEESVNVASISGTSSEKQ